MAEISVKRLPKDPGPAAWNRLLPEPEAAKPLERYVKADWMVIGAGFAGLSAARRLAENCAGDRIVVLEASRIGDGPAGRNSGFMIDLPHDLSSDNYRGTLEKDRDRTQDNRMAIDYAQSMVEDFGLPDEAFRRSGKINAAATEAGDAHNRSYAAHLDALGEPCRMMEAREMSDLTGIHYYQSGLYTPGTAMIQPAMYIRGLGKGLASNRLSLHEASPVTGLTRNGAWVAQTPKGRVTAPKVILAVNGHLNSFGFAQGRLMHVFTYASMTRSLTADEVTRLGGAPDWGVTPADPMGTTVRRISGAGGDRIVVRNRFTFDPSLEVDDGRLARVSRDHDAAFAARFPMLKGVEMAYRWGGRLCVSLNDVQVVGEVEEGLYSSCCQNGLGTVRGTLAGILAADLASGRSSAALDRALAEPAPKRLPPMPIARVGAALRLRWKERRAGREL
ncbi:MAG: FAD-binding oxidoreductase [Pseudomonadota bacterium]